MLDESKYKDERQMTAEDHARQARVCLEQSDQEFAKGDVLQASEKLWGCDFSRYQGCSGPTRMGSRQE